MAAIGQLSAAIAHEIRNAVVPLAGSVELLDQELELDGENKKLMELATRECERLNRFVSELLDYVRESQVHLETVCLNDLVGNVLELAKRHPRAEGVRFLVLDGTCEETQDG